MAALGDIRPFDGVRWIRRALAVAIAGAVVWAISMVVATDRAMYAYLTAYVFAASIAVGALVFLMIGHAMGARWVASIRRLNEAVALSVIPLAVLFIPIAVWADRLYLWVAPSPELPTRLVELLAHKRPYLNLPAFLARAAIYFAVWITVAVLLSLWSRRRDRATPPPPATVLGRDRALSSAALPAVGLALTFAAFDWVMSLEPEWVSTVFGIYVFAGGFLAAIGVIAMLARGAAASAGGAITRHHFHALGRLLLAFTVFWAYIAFFQALLIQIADRPDEVLFYAPRIANRWFAVVVVLIVGHFAVPFFLLLPGRWKFSPRWIGGLGAWLAVMHYIDVYWLVIPTYERGTLEPHWADPAALAAVLGLVAAFGAWRQHRVAVVAFGDPLLVDAIAYQVPR